MNSVFPKYFSSQCFIIAMETLIKRLLISISIIKIILHSHVRRPLCPVILHPATLIHQHSLLPQIRSWSRIRKISLPSELFFTWVQQSGVTCTLLGTTSQFPSVWNFTCSIWNSFHFSSSPSVLCKYWKSGTVSACILAFYCCMWY